MENQPPIFEPQPKPAVTQTPSANNRTPLWIISSMVIGFMLPLCACVVLTFTGVLSLSSLGAMADPAAGTDLGSGPAVAIVRVEGTILATDDENFINGAGSGTIIKELRQAENDPDVKAIVLRVDSPGGTVTGSAQIHDVIRDEISKPVVVSMLSTAASGGYYVSAPADYIFARPDTVTGSIGVILTLYNAEELLDEIGVDVIDITSGPNKSIGNPWDDLTPEQRDIFDDFIDESYQDFVRIIAEGRDLPLDEVRELADGRIYTGRQALDRQLVDELGDLPEAIDKAADLGGISGEPRIIEYERVPAFEDFLLGFNARLNQTEAERALESVMEMTMPVVEYRYAGK